MTYRLYLDEVGNDDLGHVAQERHRYLSLTGVIIQHEHARDVATPQLNAFKADVFQHDPEDPVHFHRSDILYKRGPFGILNDEATRTKFNDGLLAYLKAIEYSVITVVIDKRGMMNQGHWTNQHPYHYLMAIIAEKYAQWLERHGGRGDIMPEARKGPKDPALQAAYTEVREAGTNFVSSERIKARISDGPLKFRTKEDNVTGLQICDLLAHPSQCYVRSLQNHPIELGSFASKIVPILTGAKYDRSNTGAVRGYGVKYLP
jgi:hypothetical protein